MYLIRYEYTGAYENEGYRFIGWAGAGGNIVNEYYVPLGNQTLYAPFDYEQGTVLKIGFVLYKTRPPCRIKIKVTV